jgi:hypothetical protein
MPIARFQMPDGRVGRFEVPEGTTPEQAQGLIEKELAGLGEQIAKSQPDIAERIAGHPATRFALGAAQPILGAVQLGAEMLGSSAVTEHLQRLEEMKRKGMGEDAGIDFAGIAGTILSPAVLGAMKIPAAASVLGRAVQGAGVGAALGAATPVTSKDDFVGTKAAQIGTGAVIGGVIPPAIDAVRTVGRVARNIVDPLLPGGAERGATRILVEAAGPKRAAIEAELARPSIMVPGSQPTAPEAAAAAGSPEFSALQKIAESHRPSAYSDIARAQEAARTSAIAGFGKDKATLVAAEQARAAAANALYSRAFSQAINADPALAQLAKNPYFKDALPHALKLADAKGITAKGNLTQFLHYVKLGLDKELSKAGDTALSSTEKAAVQQLKKELIAWMGQKNPAYEQAREAFRVASGPINEMQVGQLLEQSLRKPIGVGERPASLAAAAQNAPSTIKKATGQQVAEELGDILQPQNLATVKRVLADLSRKAELERLVPLGRQRAAEAAQPFGLPATGPLHQSYMIFKTILGRVSRGINEKTLDTMADALQLPTTTLRLLQNAPSQQRQTVIDQIITQKLGRGAIAAATELSGEGIQQ